MQQPVYYVAFLTTSFRSLEEVKAKAPDALAAHLARSRRMHEDGIVLMAGAFLNTPGQPLSTMAVLMSREAAEDFIKGDPFVERGMVTEWHIHEWANMFV